MAHLWTNAPLPPDYSRKYTEYVLRKNVYHCTPEEFDCIEYDRVVEDLIFWNAERKTGNG